MPIVTAIKQQKRSQLRYNIYLDGRYSFALSDLDLSASEVRVGQSLSVEEVAAYQRQAETDQFFALAVRFVGYRPRSRQEIEAYLGRKGADAEEAGTVIGRLAKMGLANDADFAASWVASRQILRPRSKRQLEQELRAKGVSREDIGGALGQLDGEAEFEMVLALTRKKYRLPQYRQTEKLAGYLARQGYSYDLVKRAVAQVMGEEVNSDLQ